MVGNMLRIGADMRVLAGDRIVGQPVGDVGASVDGRLAVGRAESSGGCGGGYSAAPSRRAPATPAAPPAAAAPARAYSPPPRRQSAASYGRKHDLNRRGHARPRA